VAFLVISNAQQKLKDASKRLMTLASFSHRVTDGEKEHMTMEGMEGGTRPTNGCT
jgi:hypothetical protein